MAHTILIVDDEESIRFTFSEFLRESGYQVDTAENVTQALDLLSHQAYDLIFLDILLGRENGIEVLKVARKLNPNCPVIMVTGAPEVTTAAESVRLQAFDYLTKPVDREALLQHARRAINYKTALDEKQRYEQRMKAIFENIQEGVVVFDANGVLVDMNHAAATFLVNGKDLIGKDLGTLAETDSGDVFRALRELLEARCEGELFRIELARPDGEPLTLSVSLSPLQTAAGEDNDLVMVLRDESVPVRELGP